jgi:flavin reductase (DIM6/NTAB) family NADH-FMN oxidoreductase RutF
MTADLLDPLALRRAFAAFPTGVTAVCALVDGEPVGMAANSFTSHSLDPPSVSVAIGRDSGTWRRLRGQVSGEPSAQIRRLGIRSLAS